MTSNPKDAIAYFQQRGSNRAALLLKIHFLDITRWITYVSRTGKVLHFQIRSEGEIRSKKICARNHGEPQIIWWSRLAVLLHQEGSVSCHRTTNHSTTNAFLMHAIRALLPPHFWGGCRMFSCVHPGLNVLHVSARAPLCPRNLV